MDQRIVTRREALNDALRPGGHPDPPRAYSTLFGRAERAPDGQGECSYCHTLMGSVVRHLEGHAEVTVWPQSYHALLRAIDNLDERATAWSKAAAAAAARQ
jgi:hypothetical protein